MLSFKLNNITDFFIKKYHTVYILPGEISKSDFNVLNQDISSVLQNQKGFVFQQEKGSIKKGKIQYYIFHGPNSWEDYGGDNKLHELCYRKLVNVASISASIEIHDKGVLHWTIILPKGYCKDNTTLDFRNATNELVKGSIFRSKIPETLQTHIKDNHNININPEKWIRDYEFFRISDVSNLFDSAFEKGYKSFSHDSISFQTLIDLEMKKELQEALINNIKIYLNRLPIFYRPNNKKLRSLQSNYSTLLGQLESPIKVMDDTVNNKHEVTPVEEKSITGTVNNPK